MGDKSAFVGGMKLKISELGKVITGNTPSKKIKEFWDKDDVGFVKPDIISDEHIVKIKSEDCNEFISNAAISKARIVPKNSIFVTCIGNIGKIGVATENLAFNQQINAIIPNENVNLDYLCYAIFANKTRLQDIANAPIVPLLNKSQFSEFELEFDMDINTQTRIVHELNTVSNIILKYKQELLLLDELVRARFVEMFGDLESNSMNWEKSLLANKLNVIGGYAFKSSEFNECEGIPVLRIGNINSGYFKPVNMVYWKGNSRLSKYEVYPGDLVMSLTGTVGKDDYGNVCILGNEYEMYYLNQRNAKLEIVNGLNKYYLTQLLKFSCIKDKLTGINRGVRQANISNKDILDLVVPVPPLKLQNQFASFVQEVDKSRSRIQKSLEASQELFDSLMQEYFG